MLILQNIVDKNFHLVLIYPNKYNYISADTLAMLNEMSSVHDKLKCNVGSSIFYMDFGITEYVK